MVDVTSWTIFFLSPFDSFRQRFKMFSIASNISECLAVPVWKTNTAANVKFDFSQNALVTFCRIQIQSSETWGHLDVHLIFSSTWRLLPGIRVFRVIDRLKESRIEKKLKYREANVSNDFWKTTKHLWPLSWFPQQKILFSAKEANWHWSEIYLPQKAAFVGIKINSNNLTLRRGSVFIENKAFDSSESELKEGLFILSSMWWMSMCVDTEMQMNLSSGLSLIECFLLWLESDFSKMHLSLVFFVQSQSPCWRKESMPRKRKHVSPLGWSWQKERNSHPITF